MNELCYIDLCKVQVYELKRSKDDHLCYHGPIRVFVL
ncbi:hypothetical protein BRARA_J01430 [Brassica rapa]|uniref:Uncharacterized protein n=1 Tax=Brassica campestris TaxID=3711 RepID=A0A397XKI9_BRACM|nr:hypothetical protein BRARA_J01430 [Brassica rapa]